MNNRKTLTIENAYIFPGAFRNFAGNPTKYDPVGKRTFCIRLERDVADALKAEGWNIRELNPRDPGDDSTPCLSVTLNYDPRFQPPEVVLISGRKKTYLEEDEVKMLDWADILSADVVINPYYWDINGKSGIKAYCKSLYVTIAEDSLRAKYADYDD